MTPLSEGPPSHGSQSNQRVSSIHRSEGQKSYFFPPLAMGRVLVHIHGKPKGRGTRIIIDDYAGRNASAGIELIVHKDKTSPPDYEAKIESGGANIILLDESGTMVTSVELAEIISETSLSSRNTIFAVGPADGFSDEMKIKNKKISISRMTLTHEMATAILLEQLYRAYEINKGTQYHRS